MIFMCFYLVFFDHSQFDTKMILWFDVRLLICKTILVLWNVQRFDLVVQLCATVSTRVFTLKTITKLYQLHSGDGLTTNACAFGSNEWRSRCCVVFVVVVDVWLPLTLFHSLVCVCESLCFCVSVSVCAVFFSFVEIFVG